MANTDDKYAIEARLRKVETAQAAQAAAQQAHELYCHERDKKNELFHQAMVVMMETLSKTAAKRWWILYGTILAAAAEAIFKPLTKILL